MDASNRRNPLLLMGVEPRTRKAETPWAHAYALSAIEVDSIMSTAQCGLAVLGAILILAVSRYSRIRSETQVSYIR